MKVPVIVNEISIFISYFQKKVNRISFLQILTSSSHMNWRRSSQDTEFSDLYCTVLRNQSLCIRQILQWIWSVEFKFLTRHLSEILCRIETTLRDSTSNCIWKKRKYFVIRCEYSLIRDVPDLVMIGPSTMQESHCYFMLRQCGDDRLLKWRWIRIWIWFQIWIRKIHSTLKILIYCSSHLIRS